MLKVVRLVCALPRVQRVLRPKLTPTHLDGKLQLIIQFGNEQVVAQRLSHLHYPDDGGVDLVLPVLEHALRGAGLLFNLYGRSRSESVFQCWLSPTVESDKLLLKERPHCGWIPSCAAVLF